MEDEDQAKARAFRVKVEMEETKAAFDACRDLLLDATTRATTAEASFKGVLAVQALDMVRTHLMNIAQTGDLLANEDELRAFFKA